MQKADRTMLEPLTRQNLCGISCALIVPWTGADELDEKRLEREVLAYGNSGIHGVYTGGTTGEFYAQDDATFARITAITTEHAHAIGLPIQIGCTALSTRTVRQRIAVARKAGADAIQLALPFWRALKDDEVVGFLQDAAAEAAPLPLVLYQTAHAKRTIGPEFMADVAAQVPALIGTKDGGCSLEALQRYAAATDLAVFGGEHDLLERIPLGGKGAYCSITGFAVRPILDYYADCLAGRLNQARALHDHLATLREILIRWINEDGLENSAIDRVLRVAGGSDVGLRCQRPYRCASQRHVEELLAWAHRYAPEFLVR